MIDRFEQFSSVISTIHRYIQAIERDEMIKYGLKGAYTQYLVAMYRSETGLTATQLCEICSKDKAAVSRILAEMEERGLVHRNNATDKTYRTKITLTEEGRKAAEYVCTKVKRAVEAVGLITEGDRKAFYTALDRISEGLRALCEEGIPV